MRTQIITLPEVRQLEEKGFEMMTRWKAVVFYRSEIGTVDVEHPLCELADLHDAVERGPHWDTIEKIEVFRINHCDSETLTIEGAEKL